MLKFIAIFILFGGLALALAIILLVLTKKAEGRYWEDVKKYYDNEEEGEN